MNFDILKAISEGDPANGGTLIGKQWTNPGKNGGKKSAPPTKGSK